MRQIFEPLLKLLRGRNAGQVGLAIGLGLGLLLVVFGFWRSLLILAMGIGGYYVGVRFFADTETFHELLDRLFPPGRFR
ncbi:MAG: DUF2273 domain-containing protein [Bacillota bacterium]|nr:DUF2273 domain-containing protein [Bacillota bacterium]